MEFNKELRPKVGFGVFIVNPQNQILLMKRKGSHGEGTWCPPGGHIEGGESFLESVRRETKEESDINIDDIDIVGVTNDIFSKEKHYVTVFFRAKGYSGEARIMEPDKCAEMGWFNLNNLPSPLFLSDKNFFDSNFNCLCGSGKKYKKCHGKNESKLTFDTIQN